MKYLLDTNILIFLLTEDFSQLTTIQKSVLQHPDNSFVMSEASIFEMAIKARLSKLSFSNFSFEEAVTTQRKRLNIALLKKHTLS